MKYRTVKVEKENGVSTVILNRPEKKNCMSPELHQEMDEILTKLKEDKETQVLIITGAGDSFCGGMDLEKCFLEAWDNPEEYERISDVSISWLEKLRLFPKPTIASVNGWCFGGGFCVMGYCDFAIAAKEARFGLSEINFGAFPSGGATKIAVDLLRLRDALYLILTGDMIDGMKAAEIGLVNKAVPLEELEKETKALAEKLKGKNPIALRKAKEVIRRVRYMDPKEAIEWELSKVHEMAYLQKDEWINKALTKFRDKEYKPGLEAYGEKK